MRKTNLVGMALVVVPWFVVLVAQFFDVSQTVACGAGLSVMLGVGILTVSRLARAHDELPGPTFAAPQTADIGAQAETAFRADDPEFSSDAFIEQCEALCGAIANSSSLDALHPHLSDGLFQRLKTQERFGSAPRADFAIASVSRTVITSYTVGNAWQQLTARVTLGTSAEAQTRSLTFLRRRTAKTHANRAASACPHCGALLALTATQRCSHCEAIVNSGEHDWVLCEVAPGAHHLGRQSDVLDPEGVRLRDAALSSEELEDRAALTFWRWLDARRTGERARLRRVATTDLLDLLDAYTAPEGEVALGDVELRVLRSGPAGDEAHVLLRWSDGAEAPRSHQTIFKLRRPPGLLTPTALGLSTLRCTRCLAAVTDAESPGCEFCGASLQDAWCLHELEPFQSWSESAVKLRRQVGSDWARSSTEAQREAALRALASLAWADGSMSAGERDRLEALGTSWALPASLVQSCLESRQAPTLSLSRGLALSLTQELAQLAMSDGKLQPATRKRLDALAVSLGTEAELGRALAKLISERR